MANASTSPGKPPATVPPVPRGGTVRTEHHDTWLERFAGLAKCDLGSLLARPSQAATAPQASHPGQPVAPGGDARHQVGLFARGFGYGAVDVGEKLTTTLGGALHLKVSGAKQAEEGWKHLLSAGAGVGTGSRAFRWGQGAGTAVAVGGATVAAAGAVAAAAAATPVAGLVASGAAAAAGAVGLSAGAAAAVGGTAVVLGSEMAGAGLVTAAMGGNRRDVAESALFAGVAGAGGAAFRTAAAPVLSGVASAAPRLAGAARMAAAGAGGAVGGGVAAGVTAVAGGKRGEAWRDALHAAAVGGVMGAGAEGVGLTAARLPDRVAPEPARPGLENNLWKGYSATPKQVAEYVRQRNGKAKVVIHLDRSEVPDGARPADLVQLNQGEGLYKNARMSVFSPDGEPAGPVKDLPVAAVRSSGLVKGGPGRRLVQQALDDAGLKRFDADGDDVQLFREYPDQRTGKPLMVEARQGFEPRLSDVTRDSIKALRPEALRHLDVNFEPRPDTAPHAIMSPDAGARLTGLGLRALAAAGDAAKPYQQAIASYAPSLSKALNEHLAIRAMGKQFGDATTPLVVPLDLMDQAFAPRTNNGTMLEQDLQKHIARVVGGHVAGGASSGTLSGVTQPQVVRTGDVRELFHTVGSASVEQPWIGSYQVQLNGAVRIKAHYTTELHDRYDWGALTETEQHFDPIPREAGAIMTPKYRYMFLRNAATPRTVLERQPSPDPDAAPGLYSDALFSTLSAYGIATPFDTIGTTSPKSLEFTIPAGEPRLPLPKK